MEYGESQEAHLRTGKIEVEHIQRCLQNSGYDQADFKKILEFGCNNCRLLRWFYHEDNPRTLLGSDVNLKMTEWVRKNLGHVINVQRNDYHPPLNFADASFDFVFAGSVFTHIDDYALDWMIELTRITKSGGLLYLTFLDEQSMKILESEPQRPIYRRIAPLPNITGDLER